jgi:hypothetical protein
VSSDFLRVAPPPEAHSLMLFGLVGFDQASQPTLTDEERRQLLHFCVVGEWVVRLFVASLSLLRPIPFIIHSLPFASSPL